MHIYCYKVLVGSSGGLLEPTQDSEGADAVVMKETYQNHDKHLEKETPGMRQTQISNVLSNSGDESETSKVTSVYLVYHGSLLVLQCI